MWSNNQCATRLHMTKSLNIYTNIGLSNIEWASRVDRDFAVDNNMECRGWGKAISWAASKPKKYYCRCSNVWSCCCQFNLLCRFEHKINIFLIDYPLLTNNMLLSRNISALFVSLIILQYVKISFMLAVHPWWDL